MENKMTDAFFSTLPWRIASRKHSDGFYVIHGKDVAGNRELQIFKIHSGTHPAQEHLDRQQDNAEAIVTAVNSTYGKGIDPSSVPELVEAMKEMMECFDAEGGWISDYCLIRCKNALAKSIINQ